MRNGSSLSLSLSTLSSPFLLLLILLQLQIQLVTSSRDLLLNAPSSKDSLFLSQPSRDWAPGGRLAEQARRKHNARAARLRSGAPSSSNFNGNPTSSNQSNQHRLGDIPNQNDLESGSGSGSDLEDRIRAGMRLHLDQNGLASSPDRESSSSQSQESKQIKDQDLSGKSEDRLVTSGQKDKADRDANRIASSVDEIPNQPKDQNQYPKITHQEQKDSNPISENQNTDRKSEDQVDPKEWRKVEEVRAQISNQRPPAEIIQTVQQDSFQPDDDETWEKSTSFLFSNGKPLGRSGRRYSTSKGGLISSLKKLSTSFDDHDSDSHDGIDSKHQSENRNQKGKEMTQEEMQELERLRGKNKEDALKQAEEAARNAVEDGKKYKEGLTEDQKTPPT